MTGRVDHTVTIRLSRSLVADGSGELGQCLRGAVLGGARVVVLDLASAGELSSALVAAMLDADRACRARGGGLQVSNVGRRADEMLRRNGLSHLLEPPAG